MVTYSIIRELKKIDLEHLKCNSIGLLQWLYIYLIRILLPFFSLTVSNKIKISHDICYKAVQQGFDL